MALFLYKEVLICLRGRNPDTRCVSRRSGPPEGPGLSGPPGRGCRAVRRAPLCPRDSVRPEGHRAASEPAVVVAAPQSVTRRGTGHDDAPGY